MIGCLDGKSLWYEVGSGITGCGSNGIREGDQYGREEGTNTDKIVW